MNLKSINTSVIDDVTYLSVAYIDDHGHPATSIVTCDETTNKTLSDFLNGTLTADEFISTITKPSDLVEKCAETITRKLTRVSDHLSCDGLHVYFDNDTFANVTLDETLEDHLIRCINEGNDSDIKSWAKFTERLYGNTNERIRSQIVSWLSAQSWLTVDADGRLVGYRGCKADEDDPTLPVSVHTGPAIVDSIPMNGHIPNRVGSIVEMARTEVQNDPTVGCSSGLHVGTYDYACSWAPRDGYLLRVAVAPEDIVSVPFECESQKIRCCRFEVLEVTPASDVPEIQYRETLTYQNAKRDLAGDILDIIDSVRDRQGFSADEVCDILDAVETLISDTVCDSLSDDILSKIEELGEALYDDDETSYQWIASDIQNLVDEGNTPSSDGDDDSIINIFVAF